MKSKHLLATISFYIVATSLMAQVAGTINDARDGKTYQTVKIGTQTWMAENLNFKTSTGSWCYDDSIKNCDIYGRLYDLETAVSSCPSGWHLPSDEEWSTLINFLGGDSVAGAKMKSLKLWIDSSPEVNNSSGFNVLPAGSRANNDGPFYGLGENTYFWSDTDNDFYSAWERCLRGNRTRVSRDADHHTYGYSVRCLKN